MRHRLNAVCSTAHHQKGRESADKHLRQPWQKILLRSIRSRLAAFATSPLERGGIYGAVSTINTSYRRMRRCSPVCPPYGSSSTEVLRAAMRHNALRQWCWLIITRSGDAEPSQADRLTTNTLPEHVDRRYPRSRPLRGRPPDILSFAERGWL